MPENAVHRQPTAYLKEFGYLAGDTPLDSPAGRAAVRAFQSTALLPATGEVDAVTEEAFDRPRCGFPDRQGAAAPGQFVLFGTVWDRAIITYRIKNFSVDLDPAVQRGILADALARWAAVVPLVFRETTDPPDIEILFATAGHGDGNAFDGPNGILAHAFFPPPNGGSLAGDVHFDEDETWQVGFAPGGIDLTTVAFHEFGHSIGLAHTSVPNSTMNPIYPTPSTPSADDRDGVRTLYRRHIWVASLYRDVLGRRFDDEGLDFWVRTLFTGSSVENIARGFVYSQEHSDQLVTDLYFSLLDRAPDPAGLASWRNQLQQGMGRQAAIVAFLDSAEYTGKHPQDEAFVDSLYRRLLGRPPDTPGLQFWVQQLQTGTPRFEVARGFVLSEEYCRNHARTLYQRYLRRAAEPAGLQWWTTQLTQGVNHQDATIGLITSDEYTNTVVRFW